MLALAFFSFLWHRGYYTQNPGLLIVTRPTLSSSLDRALYGLTAEELDRVAGAQKVPVVALEAEGALAMRLSTFSTWTVLLVSSSIGCENLSPRVRLGSRGRICVLFCTCVDHPAACN